MYCHGIVDQSEAVLKIKDYDECEYYDTANIRFSDGRMPAASRIPFEWPESGTHISHVYLACPQK